MANSVFSAFLIFMLFMLHSSRCVQIELCTDKADKDICQQVARENTVKCKEVPSKVDCVLNAEQGLPTFTSLSAEEAFLAAGLVSNSTIVLGDIQSANNPYQTVVIVNATYSGGFTNLQGLKFCHPGYDHDARVTRSVLEQLDGKIFNAQCNANLTAVEQKYKALSEFYGSSCRPGVWIEDAVVDNELKTKYRSLCELCGSDGCSTRYTVPMNDSLNCLKNGGDFALSEFQYAEVFFGSVDNARDYTYLCPDGSVSAQVCVWTQQLPRVLISNLDNADMLEDFLNTKMSSFIVPGQSPSNLEKYLANLLQLETSDMINIVNRIPLFTYVSEKRTVSNQPQFSPCNSSVTWSVVNDSEYIKCQWLKQASIINGLLPQLNCQKCEDVDIVSKLSQIEDGKADITYIDTEYSYIARNKSLSNIAYPETEENKLKRIYLVVKNDSTWYNTLADLKEKHACFPFYGGAEWLAFVDLLRTSKIIPDTTEYGKSFSAFVGRSCLPGANYPYLNIPSTDSDKLCDLCYPVDATQTHKYCNADEGNKYYGSRGALRCLEEAADYAVINYGDLPNYYKRNLTAHQQFRVIRPNGVLADQAGFQVDDSGALAILVAGEMVFRNTNQVQYNDILLYLQQLEVHFGTNLVKQFKVFENFNNTDNLLFPNSTLGLTFGESTDKNVLNLQSLLLRASTDTTVSAQAPNLSSPVVVSLFVISLALIF